MNREQVIKFAKQVGLPHWYETEGVVNEELLVKFAKLVAEHEREQAQQAEPDYYGLTRDHLWMSITKDHHDRLKPEFRMACYISPPPRQPEQETDGVALTNIPHPKGAPATDDLNADALEVVELELPDEDEAVAWADGGVINWIAGKQFKHASYLYTTPPPRQPLTPERVFKIADQHPVEGFDPDIMAFARAIEAAVWEKQK